MFTVEQRAMADRLEVYLGVKIYEVEDPSTIQSVKLRESVQKESGRCSWYSLDGQSFYVYPPNLPDSDPYTLLKEVIEEGVMQKGLDFVNPRSEPVLLDAVWAVASGDDKLSVAYANRLPVSNINNLGRVASRSYLASLNSRGFSRARREYEDIAVALLASLSRSGFELPPDGYFVERVSRALSTFNRFHPEAVCSLTETPDISHNLQEMVEYGRTIPPRAVSAAMVSFGRLSDELKGATGFGDMEITTPLTKFMSDIRKYGISEKALTEEDIAGKIQHPVAVIGFTASVPKRGEDGRKTENARGRNVFVKEDRFCILTDMMVKDPETGVYDHLCVVLPSAREVYVNCADSLVLRGFSPRNSDKILRSIEEGELLYCDERMNLFVAKQEMRLADEKIISRRPRIGEAPNAVDPRKRLNYVASVVKDFISSNRAVKDQLKIVKEQKAEADVSDVSMKSVAYAGKFPKYVPRDGIHKTDFKTKLERAISERDFSPSTYKILAKNRIVTGFDLLRFDSSTLRPKDRGEIEDYMGRIGIRRLGAESRQAGKEVSGIPFREYPYIVDNLVGYVVGDIQRRPDQDIVRFLSSFDFTPETLSRLADDVYEKSCDQYSDLDDEDREDIRQDVKSVVLREEVLEERLKIRLGGEGIYPDSITYISDKTFEACFVRDDAGGRSFIVNVEGEPLHEGYFLFNTDNRDLGYQINGNTLSGKVIDCGTVKDVRIDLETGLAKSVSKSIK